jgi:3'(2'), 5'-bisphosphate nucleotidase
MLTDAQLAKDVARAAGDLLLDLRNDFSGDITDLRNLGDAKAHALIVQLISESRPNDAILSEEAADDFARLSADRVWIVDPLDGTWEYGEGRWDWAVHIALWQRANDDITDAAIYLPATGQLFTTDNPPPLPAWPVNSAKIVVSRTRPPKELVRIQNELGELLKQSEIADGLDLLEVGSAGAKTAALLTGDAQLYVHDGGLSEWDAAAPFAVAKATGLVVKHLDGSEIKYNKKQVKLAAVYLAEPKMAKLLSQIEL